MFFGDGITLDRATCVQPVSVNNFAYYPGLIAYNVSHLLGRYLRFVGLRFTDLRSVLRVGSRFLLGCLVF